LVTTENKLAIRFWAKSSVLWRSGIVRKVEGLRRAWDIDVVWGCQKGKVAEESMGQ